MKQLMLAYKKLVFNSLGLPVVSLNVFNTFLEGIRLVTIPYSTSLHCTYKFVC